ncbi:auxin-responsive protein SAUR50 [Rosa sericea]
MATCTSQSSKTIRQAIQLKQVMKLWKAISVNGKSNPTPSGFLPVYVGWDRNRFLIPTRFLKYPIFVALLDKSGEEFGFKISGGIVLPCDVEFFKEILNLLQKNEKRYGGLELDQFLKKISEVSTHFDSSTCKKEDGNAYGLFVDGLREPLMEKA